MNTVLYVKEFYGNDQRFVWQLLSYFDLKRFSTGAGVPTLKRNFVHDELVSIPNSKNEQQTIVAKLDALREQTQRLEVIYKRKLVLLDELKQSLLHQAFNGNL